MQQAHLHDLLVSQRLVQRPALGERAYPPGQSSAQSVVCLDRCFPNSSPGVPSLVVLSFLDQRFPDPYRSLLLLYELGFPSFDDVPCGLIRFVWFHLQLANVPPCSRPIDKTASAR